MKRLRYSLKYKLTVLFFLLVAGALALIAVANSLFLEKYYFSRKHNALTQAYESLRQAAGKGSIDSEDFDVELLKTTGKDNISIIIIDEASKTIKSYASDPQTMQRRMWENMLDLTKELKSSSGEDEYYIVQTFDDRYDQRVQVVMERRTGMQSMEMWGSLGDGSFYLLSTSVESMKESSATAARFTMYVGIAVLLIGGILSMFLGTRITKPVLELTDISKRMKDMDFSAKYDGNDRTEVAELGRNMNELSQTLESAISDLKTANAELLQDIEKKEKNEKAQQEFISGVTHELKTPIALIQGYAEGLKDGIADDPESSEFYVDVIIDEAGKMNSLVQKLLTLTHMEFGTTQISLTRFDVAEMIENNLKSAEVIAKDKDIELRLNGIPHAEFSEKIYIWSDEFMTEEAFNNYFSNALNYCSEVAHKKIIDVRITSNNDKVRISVFNTGTPIAEDVLPRIWDRFYKADKARSREYGGSGVGLSIVKAIMERLQKDYGVINYENGPAFWFEADKG